MQQVVRSAPEERAKRAQESEDDMRMMKWKQFAQMLLVEKQNMEAMKIRGQKLVTTLDPDDNNCDPRTIKTGKRQKEG